MADSADENPYVGPRPFEAADRAYFFGRVRETRDVASLVVAQPVLLLYAASGAGKSSLLNAGVLPALTEKRLEVLPSARLLASREPPPDVANVYSYALITHLLEDGAAAELGDATLAEALAAIPRRSDAPRVFVIDQFEELFTAYPQHWRQRAAFFDQLRDALHQAPLLRIVIAVREDFLAQLDPLAGRLPGGLRSRFRLERLDREGALSAVTRPLELTRRRFAAGAAAALVVELLTFRADLGHGNVVETEGEFVEPVQLQVVCRNLWNELPADVEEITAEHLHAFADVDHVLGRFYEDALAAAIASGRVRERRVRSWIDKELITPGNTRGAVYAADGSAGDMPANVVDALAAQRLIRAEWRAGARWYELTHDRLIGPIRASNERYEAARRRRRFKRVTAGIGAAASAVAAVVFALTFLWVAEPAQARDVQISALVVDVAVPFARYLDIEGISAANVPPAERRRVGVVVRFRLDARGFDGETITLGATTIDLARRKAIGKKQMQNVRVDSAAEVAQYRMWLPLPAATESFAVRVDATEFNSSVLLAMTESLPITLGGDTTPPVLRLPRDVAFEATSAAGARVNFDVKAEDAASGRIKPRCTPPSGSLFPLGSTNVSCIATDDAGNRAAGSILVSVRDTTPPEIAVPDAVRVPRHVPPRTTLSVTVEYRASAADAVDGSVPVKCFPPSGATLVVRGGARATETVTCTASDRAANTAVARFPVIVEPAVD